MRVASPSRLRSSLIPSLFSVVERGRLRKNGFSYFDSHGLGLSSSGLNEQRGSLAFDLGAAWVEDASAKLGNWFCSDFEKVRPALPTKLLTAHPHRMIVAITQSARC